MRIVTLILAVSFLHGESHPTWWTLAEPESEALVGIQWETLRDSPFAGAIRAELPDFPDLPVIFYARQMLLSGPDTLAILSGNFPVETLRQQAAAKGLKPSSYRGIELFISPGRNTLSVAQLTDQLLLLGLHKTLERAVDRSLAETGRRYSPLLARAARLAQGNDLWVIASGLPDPLASLFVPLDIEADGFEGGVSLRDGLQMGASLEAGSADHAAVVAENLRQMIPTLPEIARTMQVTVKAHSVLLSLDVSSEQLSAALRPAEAPRPSEAPRPGEASGPKVMVVTPVVPKVVEEPPPAGPQVIRIFGLDDGPREIVLPAPPKPEKQR